MKRKRIGVLAFAALLLFSGGVTAAAQTYTSYTYDYWGIAAQSPETYSPEAVYAAQDMKTVPLKQPQDLFVDPVHQEVYIADTGNNRVVVLDSRMQMVREMKTFAIDADQLKLTEAQKKDQGLTSAALNAPNGLFVDGNRLVYIADRENKRVIVSDIHGKVVRILTKPERSVNFTGVDYLPTKVVADGSGFVYVLCRGMYHGALVYTPQGEFSGYFGANETEVTLSLLADNFWRRLATPEQRAAMKKYVPIEFSNLDIDAAGFIYTSTLTSDSYQNHIKKFNHRSENILSGNRYITPAYGRYFGDVDRVWFNGTRYDSRFTDVCYRNGFIYGLDMSRGRIFQYADDGALIGAFGGIGAQAGTFTLPTAIDELDGRLLVLDAQKGSVTAFRATAYGKSVQEALRLFAQGEYGEAGEKWKGIAAANGNCQLAYIGLGKACYEEGAYTEALQYFRLGQYREGYSKAYKLVRNQTLKRVLPYALLSLAVLGAALAVLKRCLARRKGRRPRREKAERFRRLPWIWYTIRHPIKGFTDCKENRRHSAVFGLFVALLLFAALIIRRQYTGFVFNFEDPMKINVLLLFAQSVLLLVAWSVCNWSVSTLADGKGRLSEILYTGAISLTPYLACMLLSVGLSHVLVTDEGVFLTWITGFGLFWSVLMLAASQMVIHDYSFIRMLVTCVLSLVMLIILAGILVLVFSLFQQVFQFFGDIGSELNFRSIET